VVPENFLKTHIEEDATSRSHCHSKVGFAKQFVLLRWDTSYLPLRHKSYRKARRAFSQAPISLGTGGMFMYTYVAFHRRKDIPQRPKPPLQGVLSRALPANKRLTIGHP
jgi:hypothetical protein